MTTAEQTLAWGGSSGQAAAARGPLARPADVLIAAYWVWAAAGIRREEAGDAALCPAVRGSGGYVGRPAPAIEAAEAKEAPSGVAPARWLVSGLLREHRLGRGCPGPQGCEQRRALSPLPLAAAYRQCQSFPGTGIGDWRKPALW